MNQFILYIKNLLYQMFYYIRFIFFNYKVSNFISYNDYIEYCSLSFAFPQSSQ